jgi:hypothetical protein
MLVRAATRLYGLDARELLGGECPLAAKVRYAILDRDSWVRRPEGTDMARPKTGTHRCWLVSHPASSAR